MKIEMIAYASDIAGLNQGCDQGPTTIQTSRYWQTPRLPLEWNTWITSQSTASKLAAMQAVSKLCAQIAEKTYQYTKEQQRFLTLGGDHSMAIGTWSGAATALQDQGPLGLIWFDAHMDSHTPKTSKSKNIFGMPLAALLGYGDPALTQIQSKQSKLKPENLVLIGTRSYETGEAELLKHLNVRIYFMEEIKERGLTVVMQEAIDIVTRNTIKFGFSIDLDGIDPIDAPAVNAPEPNGVAAKDFLNILSLIANHPQWLAAEIAEFNPKKDPQKKTEKIVIEIIQRLYR